METKQQTNKPAQARLVPGKLGQVPAPGQGILNSVLEPRVCVWNACFSVFFQGRCAFKNYIGSFVARNEKNLLLISSGTQAGGQGLPCSAP